jgi:hypothetical protein
MATAGDKEQTFARLFRMMDSSFEVEALSALRQAPRMLHEERATFGAILGHTQHLNESNTANIIATYTSRTRHIATALTNAALRARRWPVWAIRHVAAAHCCYLLLRLSTRMNRVAKASPIRRAGSGFHGRTFQRTCGRFRDFHHRGRHDGIASHARFHQQR